jgi:hypothetical protein
MNFHAWDIALIGVVTIQALLTAYLYDPRWKALMIAIPLPFSFAMLSIGEQPNAVHAISSLLLFVFFQMVRTLYDRKLNIVLAITISAVFFSVMGSLTSHLMPSGQIWFYTSSIIVMGIGYFIHRSLSDREEPGDRTPLPLVMKVPLTFALVTGLVLLKDFLGGSMAFFPMVGVFASYEGRKSLWTMGRQTNVMILAMIPMLVMINFLTAWMGLFWALLLSMIPYFYILTSMNRQAKKKHSQN